MKRNNHLFSTVAMLVLATLVSATGCSMMGGAGDVNWDEYLANNPEVATYEACGAPSVDRVGRDVNNLAGSTYKKTLAYVEKAENNDVWNAYVNDVEKCKAEAGEGENNCEGEIYQSASAENKAKIDAYREANSTQVAAMVEQLLEVASLTVNVNDALKNPEMGSANPMTLGKSAGKVKEDLSLLLQMQQFFNTQKSILDALESHEGR